MNLWRGAVESAIRGKRGQALLKEMRDALDAMPQKSLITHDLVDDEGQVCALGCVAVARGIDTSKIDPEEPEQVAKALGIAEALAREIAYENDEYWAPWQECDDGTRRWQYMRKWVERNIKPG